MQVTMLLCDAADEVNGKLYTLGGGWTHLHRPGEPSNMALAIVVAVPYTETNKKHTLEVSLLDEDGQQVVLGSEVKGGAEFELGRPPGIKEGSDLNAVMAMTFNGLQLDPGGYVWVLTIGGEPMARTPFWVVG